MTTRLTLLAYIAVSLGSFHAGAAQQQSGASGMHAFVGSWQLDTARTKLGSSTISYEPVGDRIRVTSQRGTYTFKLDGADYPGAAPGEIANWKQVDKNTIELTIKRDGKVEAVSTRVFSPDAKTISVTTKLTGDKPATITSRMERQSKASGDNPLLGTWKQSRQSLTGQPATVTYASVANGLRVRYDGPMADEYTLIFDGNEHPGGKSTPQTKVTARKIDDRSFEEKWTRDGKVFSASTITVSADGRELTEQQQQPGDRQNEPSVFVYRRTK